jgi:hypothetical protein
LGCYAISIVEGHARIDSWRILPHWYSIGILPFVLNLESEIEETLIAIPNVVLLGAALETLLSCKAVDLVNLSGVPQLAELVLNS